MPKQPYTDTNFQYRPDLIDYLDHDKITTEETDDCVMIMICKQDIQLLLILLDLADSYRTWGLPSQHQWTASDYAKWDTIQDFVNDTRYCLMAGCEVSEIITALNEIRDAIQNQNPALEAGQTTNDVLDEVASAQGVSTAWLAVKAGLTLLFPESAIPISIGLDVIRGLVDNANNNESEVFAIAEILGSTASLPD